MDASNRNIAYCEFDNESDTAKAKFALHNSQELGSNGLIVDFRKPKFYQVTLLNYLSIIYSSSPSWILPYHFHLWSREFSRYWSCLFENSRVFRKN
jgi:hypothetical protein